MKVVSYQECLKNHAAKTGGYSLDGCGEFMPAPNANPSNPLSLKCAACGCHRNFHRRYPEDHMFLNFHHRLIPTQKSLQRSSSPSSSSPKSPQPVQQAYCGSAPHMLIALSSAGVPNSFARSESLNKRKRFRTKFSQEQKERMYVFADRLGWKMQNSDEKLVEEFCMDVGVPRRVFKVWMHNHKNLVKRVSNDHRVVAAHVDVHDDNVNGVCKTEDFEADNLDEYT